MTPRIPVKGVAIAGLLAAAVGLRAWTMLAYSPAVLTDQVHDAASYIRAAHSGLVHGVQEPLGYPIFLRVIHVFSHELAFTIGVQHALGILTGGLLFFTARRLGASAGLALVPAAVVWLCGDELFLEHAPLSEAVFTALLAAVLYCGVRCLDGGLRWPVATGVLSVACLAVRSVALPLPLLMIGWLALVPGPSRLPAWRRSALAGGACILATFGYAVVHRVTTDSWSVVAAGSGWNIYARAAEFADCRQFTPPSGTAVLCDPTPPSSRGGPLYYLYDGGPAHAAFGQPAAHDGRVRAFALTAILNQPLDFLATAGTDAVRYAVPGFGRHRPGDFAGPDSIAFSTGTPGLDPDTAREVGAYYGPVRRPRRGAADGLRAYQRVARISGIVLLALLSVGLAGVFFARGRQRWGLILLVAVALELLLVPTVTGSTWRYAVPAEGPISLAAAVAIQVLVERRDQRRPMRTTVTPSRSGTEPQGSSTIEPDG